MPSQVRVLLDGFFIGKPYGFGRYSEELVRALATHASGKVELAVVSRAGSDSVLVDRFPDVTWVHRRETSNLIRWQQFTVASVARQLQPDVVHFPANTRGLYTGGIPVVTTVHDLMFMERRLTLSQGLRPAIVGAYVHHNFRHLTVRSDQIATGSRTAQRELAQRGVPSSVVRHTVDGFLERRSATHSRRDARSSAKRAFLLHRGGHADHRNTARVIDAFQRATKVVGAEIDLRIIGVPDGASRFGVAPGSGVIFEPWIDDEALLGLYADALVVVATSLREGFGLPIIEGFGSGTPVITSNIDPMKEVAGNAALVVDPYNVESMTAAICRVVSDPGFSGELAAAGTLRYKEFGSQRAAERMTEVYFAASRK